MDIDGLTNEQIDKVLQFQDVTGIEDMNTCRDILIRHQWNLEVAIQEQLNIREGRPSMFAASPTIRAPLVVNDRFLQHVFSAHMPGGRIYGGAGAVPANFTGFLGYLVNCVFQFCYSTLSSIITTFFNALFGNNEQIVTDPLGDVMKFIESYKEKYPQHPVFYQGTYAQALNDAKHELKFLLVYLHSETLRQNDVQSFCSQTLTNQEVIDYINRNMIFWGCDVALPEGYRVSHSVNARSYPLMVIIALRANKMIIMGRSEGDCTPEELLRRLQMVVKDNEVWLNQARAERLERSYTQSLRQQQDEAYEQSLKADQEKDRLKQLERDEILKAELAELDQKRAEQEKKEEIARLKIDLLNEVPSEPPPDAPNSIHVVFKLPTGARIGRRFLSTDSLNDVYNYIFCHPNSPDTFEIVTNLPKRVLFTKELPQSIKERTLNEAGIKHREILFVNDLDN